MKVMMIVKATCDKYNNRGFKGRVSKNKDRTRPFYRGLTDWCRETAGRLLKTKLAFENTRT